MRLRFNIGQLMLLTALAALVIALLTSVYGRAKAMFQPEAVAYSPEGDALAALFSDGTVNVWNRNGREVGSLSTGQWSPFGFQSGLSLPNDDRVIINDFSGRVEVWETSTGTLLATIGTPAFSTRDQSTAISADGTTSATIKAAAQVDVDIHDLQTGQRIKRMPAEIGGAMAVALSPDGSRLATMNYRSEIEIWDIATEERIAGPYRFSSGALESAIAFSPDLRVAAAADPDDFDIDQGQPIELLDLTSGQRAMVHAPDPIIGMHLSPDGRLLAARGARDVVMLVDTGDGELRGTITPAYTDPVFQLPEVLIRSSAPIAFSPDGKEVLIGSNAEVAIYDLATGQRKKQLWGMRQSLGKWFFGPAFMVWAVFWGLARRRQRISEASAADDTVEAEVVSDDSALAESEDDAMESTTDSPPQSLITAWVLLAIGGVIAIGWSMFIIFNQISCFALTPMPYFSLYSGLVTIAAAAGRRTDKLPLVHTTQMGNLICCDAINFTFGIAGLILVNRPAARKFTSGTPTHSPPG